MIIPAGKWIKDEQGRTLLLHGVNLGGSSKVPTQPNGATHLSQGFFNHREVSFTGRPFPLDEADEHFDRLRRWGFNCLRLLVTWEAVEHSGPGQYDTQYLDYLQAVAQKAGEHGLDLFIDPHQDAWSRFSGGDGAPGWTFEAAGLDITHFAQSGAAIVHQTHGDPFPKMVWPTNYAKLAAATMFTLFFAGNDFAPLIKVDGEPIQEYLQRHFLASMQQVARRLIDLPNVVGYDTLNEPSGGYAGYPDLRRARWQLKLGDNPTPYQSMLLGCGIPQEVEVWKLGRFRLRRTGVRWANQERVSAWLPGFPCIWRQHGVWEIDSKGVPQLRDPYYFQTVRGRQVDVNQDYLLPFIRRYTQAIREVHPGALMLMEIDVEHEPPSLEAPLAQGSIYGPHWYDALTLVTRKYSPFVAVDARNSQLVVGAGNIRRSFAAQLRAYETVAEQNFCGIPVLMGETGIPFNLYGGRAYRSGDFSAQVHAMQRILRLLDDALLGAMLWGYTSDNDNTRGDQWNGEDFSIFSRDQQTQPEDPNSGGRALEALLRPGARRVAGEPLLIFFDVRRKTFKLVFRHDPRVTAPSEIFLPATLYPGGYQVMVSDGSYELHPEQQTLAYWYSSAQEVHTVEIKPSS